ncbi:hypothetical protein THRCLA_05990 [Thraustotheca clavata]|uniref:CAP-Gly domain-containing protein n=1 Tax=Thraustotheca clavata TaxID=74557 RepID=A0A1V9ZRF9_9STRA|nr:hypothetical protein THRCLA_05990 [Thraustotheca clavata]
MSLSIGESVLALYASRFLENNRVYDNQSTKDDSILLDMKPIVQEKVDEKLMNQEKVEKTHESDFENTKLAPEDIPTLLQSILNSTATQKTMVQSLMTFTESLSRVNTEPKLTSVSIRETAEYVVAMNSGQQQLSLARATHVLGHLALQAEATIYHLMSTIGGNTPLKSSIIPEPIPVQEIEPIPVKPTKQSSNRAKVPTSPLRRYSRKPSLTATLEQIGGSFREYLYPPEVEESLCSPRAIINWDPPAAKALKRKKPPRIGRLVGRAVILFNGMAGVVRFAGTTEFANGTMYGIELNEPHGKHNGTVHGITYFSCTKNANARTELPYGVFVRETQIKGWL